MRGPITALGPMQCARLNKVGAQLMTRAGPTCFKPRQGQAYYALRAQAIQAQSRFLHQRVQPALRVLPQ